MFRSHSLEIAVAKAEGPILWPPDVKSQVTGKDSDAEKNWKQEEKGAAEDEMVNITDSMDMNLSKLWEIAEDRGAWYAAVQGVSKSRPLLSHLTTSIKCEITLHKYIYRQIKWIIDW